MAIAVAVRRSLFAEATFGGPATVLTGSGNKIEPNSEQRTAYGDQRGELMDGARNLMLERSDKSVWDKPGLSATLGTYDRERWIGAAVGSGLAMIGARRGGFAGGLLATLGAALAVRAAMGRHDLRVVRGMVDNAVTNRGWRAKDVVADASEESFPASDSPSWTPTAGARTNR